MEDIFKSIKAFLYDRSSSPLFGAFVISWSAWNYRVISILLSDEVTETKFTNIDELFKAVDITLFQYHFSLCGQILNGFLYPAIAALAYIYVYPLLAKPVYEHSLKKQKELREIKQNEENNRLLSVEESRQIYNRLSELQYKYDEDTNMYRKQISSLSQTIKELESKSSPEMIEELISNERSDDINDKQLQVFDNVIRNTIELMPDKDFQLSDLFDNEDWNKLPTEKKQAIGKKFRKQVERGDYIGVSLKGKGTGNQIIYTKSNNKMLWKNEERLSGVDENILMEFSGLDKDVGLSEKDIQKITSSHIDVVRLHLEELAHNKYIKYLGTSNLGDVLYELDTKGRRYLVDNNLLK